MKESFREKFLKKFNPTYKAKSDQEERIKNKAIYKKSKRSLTVKLEELLK